MKFSRLREKRGGQVFSTFLFYGVTVPVVFSILILMMPVVFVSPKFAFRLYSRLMRVVLFFLNIFLGIRVTFENLALLEDLKKQYPCFLLAVKHQSIVETLIFSLFFDSFNIILKKEALKIPIAGFYMKHMKFIAIDRNEGKQALKSMIEQCEKSVQEGRPILIFPEGTRVPVGQKGVYRKGVAVLYKNLSVPILPVAHNAGAFFPHRQLSKKPGVITFRFLPPILLGLEEEEALATVEKSIESACQDLASRPERKG
ncbi:lysophosphatidic acid acyltransferase [Alphaproteobacteria bacterium]|nr:lysophosphatidic acid acyltransferase [Alphaproteobacteria bacterium]GHS96834.1 lysophosphatidic acid acyltransferase [Alphaproteobacteria bacterium]